MGLDARKRQGHTRAVALIVPVDDDCSFCRCLRGCHPYTVLERLAKVALLVTREQRGVGHVLAVPTAHRPTLLDLQPDELTPLMELTQRAVAAIVRAFDVEGVAVWQNNGVPAHQSVPHVHFHVTGTLPGGGTDWGRVPKLSVGETDEIAERLRPHLKPTT
jgi:histidine triad (HIT) family protein